MKSASRRDFLIAGTLAAGSAEATSSRNMYPEPNRKRVERAKSLRIESGRRVTRSNVGPNVSNGDYERYPNKIATFTKSLPHDKHGEVIPKAFETLAYALRTGAPADFEAISVGGDRKLTNPLAGYAFDSQGGDPQGYTIRPAPAFDSAEIAGEVQELYWMALTRDVPFESYEEDPVIRRASGDLTKSSDFRGPKTKGAVTPRTLYRGGSPGVLDGPYISQFLYRDTYFGSEKITRRFRTVAAGRDYGTNYADWLSLQNGNSPWREDWDPTPRYIRNGRDLGQWVHYDVLFQAYLEALLVLFTIGARHFMGSPYRTSRTQMGFGTLGSAHIASLVCGVSKPALKAAWYQKWLIHMRARPEEFAGRVHNQMSGNRQYPIHRDILTSAALRESFDRNGTYLLPQAFPEGSPTHPAYAAGHATVAGACATVLKAFYEEDFEFRAPKVATPDGRALVNYEGPDRLTVGGELNKLAYNIANGRNMAGIHWRSDSDVSLKLGETIAIDYLRDERAGLQEKFPFSVTRFDGTKIEF